MNRKIFIFSLLIFCNASLAKKFSLCSEKWLYQVKNEAPVGISILSLSSLALPIIMAPVLAGVSRATRQKSKAAHLLESAGIMYAFRKQKDLIDSKHILRVTKFYDRYIAFTIYKTLRLNEVIKTLAKYDNIAYGIKKCQDFGFMRNGEVFYSKRSIGQKIFPEDHVDSVVIRNLKNFKEKGKKNLEDRQKDMNEWVILNGRV